MVGRSGKFQFSVHKSGYTLGGPKVQYSINSSVITFGYHGVALNHQNGCILAVIVPAPVFLGIL